MEQDKNVEHRLTEVEQRSKSNTRRLDEMEKRQDNQETLTVIYTAVFSGTESVPTTEVKEVNEPGSFNWLWLMLPVGVLALGGCGYAGYKGFKHYQNKKRGYE